MKISEEQRIKIEQASYRVFDAVRLGVNPMAFAEFAEICISISVEIAMQHRHVIETEVIHPGTGRITRRNVTNPAEAIDHE